MKKVIPLIVIGIALVYTLKFAIPPKYPDGYALNDFGRLPVLLNGRIQPLDTVARNTLIQIAGSSKVPETKVMALPWFMELITDQEQADDRHIFRLHHPEIIQDLNLNDKGYRKKQLYYFSLNELRPHLKTIFDDAVRIGEIKPQNRNHQERQIIEVANAVHTYQRLRISFVPQGMDDLKESINGLQTSIELVRAEALKQQSNQPFDEAVLNDFLATGQAIEQAAGAALPSIIPPEKNQPSEAWTNVGSALMSSIENMGSTGGRLSLNENLQLYAEVQSSYKNGDVEGFNKAVKQLGLYMQELDRPHKAARSEWYIGKLISATFGKLVNHFQKPSLKAKVEYFLNHLDPFACAKGIYMLGFVAALIFVARPKWQASWTSALGLTVLAFAVHSFGILLRMLLEGRPPVTNLYSSAVFVGWGAILLALFTEVLFRNGLSILGCTLIGFATLMVAHALSLDGDTMAMLQAVLDTNAWLATHVTTVTLGYSATFVAGFLGLVYMLMGITTPYLDRDRRKMLGKVIYGIVCFATLFSFVGTILGGIWADQSWGRFWGWDPKENGALLIVIFNAIILHARWGGMIRERGLVAMVIFGNVITAFSWFGTNLLGVGLHSYGFMEGTFRPLTLFMASQVLLTLTGMFLPEKFWLSYRRSSDGIESPKAV